MWSARDAFQFSPPYYLHPSRPPPPTVTKRPFQHSGSHTSTATCDLPEVVMFMATRQRFALTTWLPRLQAASCSGKRSVAPDVTYVSSLSVELTTVDPGARARQSSWNVASDGTASTNSPTSVGTMALSIFVQRATRTNKQPLSFSLGGKVWMPDETRVKNDDWVLFLQPWRPTLLGDMESGVVSFEL